MIGSAEVSSHTCAPTGKASPEIHLSDLEVYPPDDDASTTPPISPPHYSAAIKPGSSIPEMSFATPSSSAATLAIPTSSSSTAPPTSIEESADSSEPEQLLNCDCEELLRSVEEFNVHSCDWKVDGVCLACLFTNYRRACIGALVAREITKTDIADLMAVIGVFAPSLATKRMLEFFSQRQVDDALGPKPELPEIDIDDSKIMNAIRVG